MYINSIRTFTEKKHTEITFSDAQYVTAFEPPTQEELDALQCLLDEIDEFLGVLEDE